MYGNFIHFSWNTLHNQVSFPAGDTSNNCRALAKIIRKIGHVAQATYTSTGTSVSSSMVDDVIEYYGYTSSGLQYYVPIDSVLNSLNNDRPVLAGGYSYTNNDYIGHLWVVDGYVRKERVEDYYTYTTPHYHMFTAHTFEYTDYLHCNWGWNGSYNGYVLNFHVNNNYQFSIDNSFIYNITPQQ